MFHRRVVIAVLAVAAAFARDESFTGKWVLDKSASTGTCEIPDNLRQEIKRKGGGYLVETSWREPRSGIAPLALLGIMTTSLQLDGDGAETRNQIGPFMQVSKTSVDGNRMITDWTAAKDGQQVTGHWTRTLSGDGKMLTLEVQESESGGKSAACTLVFKRK